MNVEFTQIPKRRSQRSVNLIRQNNMMPGIHVFVDVNTEIPLSLINLYFF